MDYDQELQSRRDAERIIELAADSPLGYIALSDSWLTYPEYDADQARAALEQAQALDPANPQVLWRVAFFAEYDQRLDMFDEAEAAGARGWRFLRFAGWNLYEQSEWQRALPYLQAIRDSRTGTEYDRTETDTLLMGALIHTEQSHLAYPIAQAFIESNPYPDAFANAAYVAFRAGELEQARQWARNAVALSSEVPQAQYLLGMLAWHADNDLEAALNSLAELEEVALNSPYLNFSFEHDIDLDRARILMLAGEPEQALAFYDATIERYCCEAWLFEERADNHLDLDQTEQAIADLRMAYDMTEDAEYRQALLNRLTELNQ
jgi:Flp pilus assembly protein TadD